MIMEMHYTRDPIDDVFSAPGLYILYHDGKIYIGISLDLSRRIAESIRERNFGSEVEIFFWPYLSNKEPPPKELKNILLNLEELSISTLHTIIYGMALERQYGLGIINDVWNNDKAYIIPLIAWDKRRNQDFRLPIQIAQNFLKSIGIPEPLTELPSPVTMFHPNFPQMSKLIGKK